VQSCVQEIYSGVTEDWRVEVRGREKAQITTGGSLGFARVLSLEIAIIILISLAPEVERMFIISG